MANLNKTRLLIIQKSYSNYRKGIFDLLNEKYDFLLLHSTSQNGVSQIRESYSRIIKKYQYWKNPTNVYLDVIPSIVEFKPDVVIYEFTPSLLSIYQVLYLKSSLKFKLILWGHGFNRKSTFKSNTISFFLRKYLMRKADAVLFYDKESKEKIDDILPGKKYFVANNTLDTVRLNKIMRHLQKQGIRKVKNEIGIKWDFNLIFIGRLLKTKLLVTQFVKVLKYVQKNIELGIIIIGDGPEKSNLIRAFKENNIINYIFKGSVHDENLCGKYLYISDLLIMPGYLGLSVVHAFAFDTPVISFAQGENGPFHSPEVIYVKDYETGFLIKDFNINCMGKTILTYLLDEELRQNMRQNIQKMINSTCSINNMAAGFNQSIEYVMSKSEL
jgi:glycosyltransferase involved in cell wall biosynthesis